MKSGAELAIDLRMYRMSGIGRYLQTLIPRLLPHLRATHVIVLGDPEDLRRECWASDSRINFRPHRARIFSADEQLATLRGLYRGVDLLWTPQYNVPVFYRGRLLVTVHDVCQLAMPETLANSLQRWYSRFLFGRVKAQASAVLCVSEFTARELHRWVGIERERITVAYPAVNDYWFRTPDNGPLPRSNPYLLAVGNLKKHKNLASAVEAFRRIKAQIPHDLVIVGERERFRNADTAIADFANDRDPRVVFTGHVTDEDLRRFYQHASGLIFPSRYEGFGSPLMEAMALECPIACSRAASLPEVAGDAALYFDPTSTADIATALLRLAGDANLRDDLKEKGRARLQRFRGEESVNITADLMNRLLED